MAYHPARKMDLELLRMDIGQARVCRELSGRKNPSLAFIKVVYSYWMKDLHQVKSCRVEDKLLSESEV